jgi:hypothetical protein
VQEVVVVEEADPVRSRGCGAGVPRGGDAGVFDRPDLDRHAGECLDRRIIEAIRYDDDPIEWAGLPKRAFQRLGHQLRAPMGRDDEREGP